MKPVKAGYGDSETWSRFVHHPSDPRWEGPDESPQDVARAERQARIEAVAERMYDVLNRAWQEFHHGTEASLYRVMDEAENIIAEVEQ